MHIDATDDVPVARKATFTACPISALGLMFVLAYRTLATCASFRASEALDASLCGFMCEVIDVLAIFPQGHALIMVTPTILVTYTMGIADEEEANKVLLAKVDHFARGFVAQITNVTFGSSTLLVLGPLQPSPTSRALFATRLLFGQFSQLHVSLSFERADATACHDHSLARVGTNSSKMDFTQIDSCMNRSRCFFSLWCLDTGMQFKTMIPNEATCTAVLRKLNRQDDGLSSLSHGQNNTSIFTTYSLSRPFDRIEAFFSPWIFHSHLWMGLTELACGVDIGEESMYHHLHRLTVQGKLSTFGPLLQLTAPWPFGMFHSGLLMDLTTEVPHFGGFHLSISQASKQF
jgi:hypothetical protein